MKKLKKSICVVIAVALLVLSMSASVLADEVFFGDEIEHLTLFTANFSFSQPGTVSRLTDEMRPYALFSLEVPIGTALTIEGTNLWGPSSTRNITLNRPVAGTHDETIKVMYGSPSGTLHYDTFEFQNTGIYRLVVYWMADEGGGDDSIYIVVVADTAQPQPTPTPVPSPTPPADTQAPNVNNASNWAREGINDAYALGLIPQALQSNYTQATTRAEFSALAVALYETVTGSEITGRANFNDTNDVNVRKMGYLGVVQGVGGGNFAPNNTITREQAAVMLARLAYAIGQPLPASAPTFADNDTLSSWAVDGVGQMQASGIMGGVGNNRFNARGEYTREQSIITMLRLFELLG